MTITTRRATSLLAALATLALAGTALAGPRIVGGAPETSGTTEREDVSTAGNDARPEVATERTTTRPSRVAVVSIARPWTYDFGIGMTSVFLDGDWIDAEGTSKAFGLVSQFRWRVAPAFALAFEHAVSFRGGEGQSDLFEMRSQHSVGVQWFMLGWSLTNFFVSGGGSLGYVALNQGEYHEETYGEFGGYAGVGAELDIDMGTLVAELRGLYLTRLDEHELDSAHLDRTYTRKAPTDRWGAMVNLSWHFGW